MYMENLPDGMHDVLVSRHGDLYIAGFDSRRRVCLVLFAPPFGNPLRTVSELPYRDYGRFTPTVRAAKDPARADNLYVLLYLHPDNLGLMQTSLYRIDVLTGRQVLLTASSSPFWAPEGMLPRADGTVLAWEAKAHYGEAVPGQHNNNKDIWTTRLTYGCDDPTASNYRPGADIAEWDPRGREILGLTPHETTAEAWRQHLPTQAL